MSAMRLSRAKGWGRAGAWRAHAPPWPPGRTEHDLVLAGADDVADVEAMTDEGGGDARDVESVDDHVDEGVDEFEVEDGPLAGDLVVVEGEVRRSSQVGLADPLHLGFVAADHRIGNPARGDQRRVDVAGDRTRPDRNAEASWSIHGRQARWPSCSPLPRGGGWAERSVPTRCAAWARFRFAHPTPPGRRSFARARRRGCRHSARYGRWRREDRPR